MSLSKYALNAVGSNDDTRLQCARDLSVTSSDTPILDFFKVCPQHTPGYNAIFLSNCPFHFRSILSTFPFQPSTFPARPIL